MGMPVGVLHVLLQADVGDRLDFLLLCHLHGARLCESLPSPSKVQSEDSTTDWTSPFDLYLCIARVLCSTLAYPNQDGVLAFLQVLCSIAKLGR